MCAIFEGCINPLVSCRNVSPFGTPVANILARVRRDEGADKGEVGIGVRGE